MREAMQWVHDRTVDGMNRGTDVHTLMHEVSVPARLDLGEGYGKTAWNVRAIWETYAGWFHHRSTTELYPEPATTVARDIVAAAGAGALVAIAQDHVDAGRPIEALHLTDLILTSDPADRTARATAAAAHRVLLEQSTNFWETAWLRRAIDNLEADR
jgi:alkyl sulfatase BDS1-like metallo-beta-lactamase superfamily hydrolase